jgi:dihydroorotase
MPTSRTALVNAHLLDPATGLDGPGGVLVSGEIIAEVGPGVTAKSVPSGTTIIDCGGKYLAPGIVDMRVQLRDPGEEHKETLATGGLAAVAGGVTSMVCLPNTDPILDDEAVLEFVARRARLVGLAKVYAYGAATKGLKGEVSPKWHCWRMPARSVLPTGCMPSPMHRSCAGCSVTLQPSTFLSSSIRKSRHSLAAT